MVKVRQQLKENDFQRRSDFSYWFLQQCNNPHRFLSIIVIGHEASSTMNGVVNTQNVREYSPKGQVPEFIYERKDSRKKLTVWVGLCGNRTLQGPYSFDGNVNGYNYLRMINNFAFSRLHFNNQFDGVFHRLWWFQDGAPAHCLKAVRHRLHEKFVNLVVALYHEVEWPPRSPDTILFHFSLWLLETASLCHSSMRYTGQIVFENLRQNSGVIRNAVRSLEKRAQICIEKYDRHD